LPARVDSLIGADRQVILGKGEARVAMVEHLLGAAAGLGVANLLVEVDAPELPILDGSARPYVDAFLAAGLITQDAPRLEFRPRAEITLNEGDASIAFSAGDNADELQVTYVLDYGAGYLKRQELTLRLSPEVFAREVAPARTYILRPEVQTFRERGLGGGATRDNLVIVEEDGASPAPLRFPDECVRHKILDLVGDLSLAGLALSGRIVAYKAGHRLHLGLARTIARQAAEAP
jgi:UDP-3-O-acyl N-acetylglucosamine deacetylase